MLNEFAPKSPVLLSTTLSLIHYVLYTMAFFKFLREKFLRALALALYLPSGFFFFLNKLFTGKLLLVVVVSIHMSRLHRAPSQPFETMPLHHYLIKVSVYSLAHIKGCYYGVWIFIYLENITSFP